LHGAFRSKERAVFDLISIAEEAAPVNDAAMRRPSANGDYRGPERRRGPSSLSGLLVAMLDEIDYGMLLVADDLHLLHANHVARAELDAEHPLQVLGRELRARQPHDVAPLHGALTDACRRRLRRLVTLGDGRQRVCLAVVPIPAPGDATPTSALVMLGKRQVCQDLSVEAFARAHALTPAETQVLKALCSGARPGEIALQHSVALSTVRSQVGSIRAKTGAETIGALVRTVALLPPMVGALRRSLAAAADRKPACTVAAGYG
jgi:DNA-binding CsgD family transcriptional regulator